MADDKTPDDGTTDPISADLDALIAKQKKQRRTTLVIVALLVVVVAGGIGIWLLVQPEPRCDPDDVAAFLDEPGIPAAAVSGVCRFDGALGDALVQAQASPPGMTGLIVMQAVADTPELVTEVCPGGIEGLAKAPAEPPGEQVAVFLEHCPQLEDTPLSQTRMRRAPLERVVLAIAVYNALRETDGDVAAELADAMLTR